MASADMCEHGWPGTGCEECKAEARERAQQAEPVAPAPAQDERVAWEADARDYGDALNDAAWVFIDECLEKSALLFNNCKVPLRSAILKYAEIVRANRPAQTEQQHPDDAAVDRFAAAMKAKLAAARAKGRGGWDDPNVCSVEFLAQLLVEHLAKGNAGTFEDVANFAMMLHQRGAEPKVLADAAPIAQTAPRCQCCGYLVTDSEHRGCLRAAMAAQGGN